MSNIGKRLETSFYLREDVVQVSKDLLGKTLVTNFNNQLTAGKIVETEAYRAPDDKACHAYQNLRTKRIEVMFKAVRRWSKTESKTERFPKYRATTGRNIHKTLRELSSIKNNNNLQHRNVFHNIWYICREYYTM